MDSAGKSISSGGSVATKFLAVFMSVLLVLAMFNISAFATSNTADEGTAAGSGAVALQSTSTSYSVAFETQDSFVQVLDQDLAGTIVNIPAGSDLVFTAHANAGYANPVVTATSSAYPDVPIEKNGDTYTINSAYITDDSLKVKVTSAADPSANNSSNEAQPLGGVSTEGSGVKASPNNLNIMGSATPLSNSTINGYIALVYAAGGSNPTPQGGNIITDSGKSITAKLDLNLVGATSETFVVAIPVANDGAIVDFTGVPGVQVGVVESSLLPGLDQSYSHYAIAIVTKANDGTLLQTLTSTFSYPSLTTAAGSSQPVIGYLLKGTNVKPEGSITGLLGSNVWVDTSYETKITADSYNYTPEVETHSITKTLTSINNNGTVTEITDGIDPNMTTAPTELDYGSTGGTYVATYTIAIESSKSGSQTGRVAIDGNAVLTDTLAGMLAGGVPTSIKITPLDGSTASVTVNNLDVASLNLALTAIGSSNVLNNQSYKVEVTYNRDAYTDFVGAAPTLVDGNRQTITNTASASVKYVTDADVKILPTAGVQNAIGYKQNDPEAINYTVQKMIGTSSSGVLSNLIVYNTAAQAKYPTNPTVSFALTKLDESGNKVVGTEVGLPLGGTGQVIFRNLDPNATYILEETEGVSGFNSITAKYVEVKTTSTATTITTKDSFDTTSGVVGTTYNANNLTENDGKVTINVKSQTVTGNTVNETYVNQSGKTVQLKYNDNVVATAVTDANGNVSFDYLDKSKTYTIVVDGIDAEVHELSDESHALTIESTDYGTTINLKYWSKFGSLTVTKTFSGIVNNAANLSATFVLKSGAQYVKADGTLTSDVAQAHNIIVNNGSMNGVKFPVLLTPGTYSLDEIDITSTNATDDLSQFTLKTGIAVTIGKGKAVTETVVNSSTKGKLTVGKTFSGPSTQIYTGYAATFKIKDSIGNFVKAADGADLEITVGHNGSASFPLLAAGNYKLVETGITDANNGDITQFIPQTVDVTITAGQSTMETVKNESIKGGLSIKKTFVGVENYTDFSADFKIKKSDGTFVKDATGADVVVTVKNGETIGVPILLETANYTLEEIAVKNANSVDASAQFELQKNIAVSVTAGSAQTKEVTNTSSWGELTIQNFDYKTATSANLTVGVYVYEVKNTADGTTYEVTLAEGEASKSIVVPAGSYSVLFKSTSDNNANKRAEVGSPVDVAVATKSTGSAKVSPGSDALALNLNGAKQTAAFMYGFPVKVTGTKADATKTGTAATILNSGAKFELYKQNGTSYVTTGRTIAVAADGAFSIEGLAPGKYQLVETIVPDGYATPKTNTEFEVKDYTYYGGYTAIGAIQNAPYAHLQINLVSTLDGSQLGGATFDLVDSNNNVVGTAAVTTSGFVKFYDGSSNEVNLEPGATYTVVQKTGVNGYEVRADVATVIVKDNGAFGSITFVGSPKYANQSSNANNGTITFSNVPFTSVTAVKYGEVTVYNGDGSYKNAKLAGAKFILLDESNNILKVTKSGSTYTIVQGEYATSEDDTSAHIISGVVGTITIDGLDPTKTYTLHEIEAPPVTTDGNGNLLLEYDLDKSEDVVINASSALYEYEYNSEDEIVRYMTSELDDVNNYIEDTAQLELNKVVVKCTIGAHYPTGSSSQHASAHDELLDPAQACVLKENAGASAANAVFDVWCQLDNGTWIYIETIVTGTAYDGNLNKALTSQLPAGQYRLVEKTTPIYAKPLSDNHLYTIDEQGNVTEAGYRDADEYLVYEFEITEADVASNSKIEVKLANDDNRGPIPDPNKYVSLYGQKLGFEGYDAEGAPLSNVVFEVYLGYYDEHGVFVELTRLANTASGQVDGDSAGFRTQYASLTPYYESESITNFVFKLVELGPLPHNYDQTSINAIHYVTIPDYTELPPGFSKVNYDQAGVEGAQIANYEAGATVEITKLDEEGNLVSGSEFILHERKNGGPGISGAPTIFGNGGKASVIAGNYYLSEERSPSDYNRNGTYSAKLTYLDGTFVEWSGVFNERDNGRITGENGSIIELPWGSNLEITITDNKYASFTIDNAWDGVLNNDPAGTNASYTVTYSGSYADPAIGSIVVTGIQTFHDLPDGTYTITETAITDANVYNMNAPAKSAGIVVTIEDGKVKSVTSGGTAVDTTFANGVQNVSYNNGLVGINHLTKTKLVINKGYIDAAGKIQNSALTNLTQAVFNVKGSDGSDRTYTWPANNFMYLEDGVTYTVVEQSVFDATKYTIDANPVYVKGADTGTVYLRNNNTSYGATSTATSPLVKGTTAYYFYNKMNVGQLTITKTKVDGSTTITAGTASFVLFTKNGSTNSYFTDATFTTTTSDINAAYKFTTTSGKVTINNIPTPNGADTKYFIKEVAAPAGYYNVDTDYEVTIKANTANTYSVKNPELQSLTIKKLTDEKTVDGVKTGNLTVLGGQMVELYRISADGQTKTKVGEGTTAANGIYTFTGLSPEANGNDAYYMIVEKTPAAGTILNDKYADPNGTKITKMIKVSCSNMTITVSAVEDGIDKNLPSGYTAFEKNTLTIKNPAVESLTVKKLTDATDSNGKKTGGTTYLNGQAVDLYKVEDSTVTQVGTTLTTAGEGTATFTGLTPNVDGSNAYYMIVEKNALAGYGLNPAYTSTDAKKMIKVSYVPDDAQGASIKVTAVSGALATDLPGGVSAFVSEGKANTVTIKNPALEAVTVQKVTNKVVLDQDNKTVQIVMTVPGQKMKLYRLTDDGTGKSVAVPADGAAVQTDVNGKISYSGLTPVNATTPAYYMVVEQASVPYLNLNDKYVDPNGLTVVKHLKVSYVSDATDGLVIKVESQDVDTSVPEGYTAFENNTLTINNPYNNNIIVAVKVDATTNAPLVDAEFKLVNSSGAAILDINNNEVIATSDASGYAYFEYAAKSGADMNNIYVLETKAPDGYLLSTYTNEILQKVEKNGTNTNVYKIVKFVDRKVQTNFALGLKKDGQIDDVSLALNDANASFTITPSNAQANTVPLNNYKVNDTSISFNNGSVISADLSYTVNSVRVNEPTSASGLTQFVSFDNGATWNAYTSGSYTATLNAQRDASMADSLFTVLYGEGTSSTDVSTVVGTNFKPGTIEVSITFDQFNQIEGSSYVAEITSIKNTATVGAQYQSTSGWTDAAPKIADKTLTLKAVDMPKMSITKEVLTGSDKTQAYSSGWITYRIHVANTSSTASVVNPVVIDEVDENLRADVSNGVLQNSSISFDGNSTANNTVAQIVGADERAVVWDFSGYELKPGKTITIEYRALVESVVTANKVVNSAYATSKFTSENYPVYTSANPTGARYIPQSTQATATEYAGLSTKTGIFGGIYIKAAASHDLKSGDRLGLQRSIKDPSSGSWVTTSNPVDHLLTDGKISYKFEIMNDYDVYIVEDLSLYEVVPYLNYLGTDMSNGFLNQMTITNIQVNISGIPVTGATITYATDTGLSEANVYDANYSELSAVGATGFKVELPAGTQIISPQVVTVTYDLEFPTLDLTSPTDFELLNNSAYKVVDAKFYASFERTLSSNLVKVSSNNVVARLVTESLSIQGTVWDDESNVDLSLNRNDIFDVGDATIEGATVTLYQREKGSTHAWVSANDAEGNPVAAYTTAADGAYVFNNLTSSYGEGSRGAMEYKVEVAPAGATPVTQFSLAGTFTSGNTGSVESHIANTISDDPLMGDTDAMQIYYGNNIANAGVREAPKVTYEAGDAGIGADMSQIQGMPNPAMHQGDDATFGTTRTHGTYNVTTKVPTLPGYTFLGWKSTLIPAGSTTSASTTGSNYVADNDFYSGSGSSFLMTEYDTVLTALWAPTDAGSQFTVEYYFQDIVGDNYVIDNSMTKVIPATAGDMTNDLRYGDTEFIERFAGFDYFRAHADDLTVDVVRGDNSTVLKLHYNRLAYTVNYEYTGTVPAGAPTPYAAETFRFGQDVTVKANMALDGYTFSGWDRSGAFKMPADNVTIYASWTANPAPITPGTVPDGPLAPVITPIINVLADVAAAATGSESTINDDDSPLARFGAECWIHWYILLGIIITAIYSTIVIVRRRKFTKDLQGYENEVMGKKDKTNLGTSGSSPQGQGA